MFIDNGVSLAQRETEEDGMSSTRGQNAFNGIEQPHLSDKQVSNSSVVVEISKNGIID